MAANKTELIINDFTKNIFAEDIEENYINLYEVKKDSNDNKNKMNLFFAFYHQKLNNLLDFMNYKIESNFHYNANQSRELIATIGQITSLRNELSKSEYKFDISEKYELKMQECSKFLSEYSGSTIPEDTEIFSTEKYEKIFTLSTIIQVPQYENRITDLKYLGDGAFAICHSFIDSFLNIKLCRKTLNEKKNLKEKDYLRFENEFLKMRELNSPYLVKAYSISNDKKSYIMEYCDYTLDRFISENNTKLTLSFRKQIALQFLNALKYLYSKELLHRDLSYRNILLKKYDDVIVVKLSDFGLVKDESNQITDSDSSIKGTFVDPCLDKFSNYNFVNEVYSIGFMLIYIFTGKKNIEKLPNEYVIFKEKFITTDLNKRFNNIDDIINLVKRINQ